MNRFLVLLYFMFLLALKPNAQNELVVDDKYAFHEMKSVKSLSLFTESKGYNETDFIYQRMEWQIDPSIHYISGKITSHFISKSATLDTIRMDLHNDLQVDSVLYHNLPIGFIHSRNKIVIPFSSPLDEETLDSVSIYYRGVPPGSGFGSFETGVHGPNSTPVLWTLSEPYGAMEWWPCKQSLADKIDSVDIIVKTPEAYRTASNGIVVSDKVLGSTRTMHWKHRHPIATYLVAIAATNYSTYSDTLKLGDGRYIDILNYVYPETLETAKTRTPVTVEVMQFYNELIGEYPFADEKYGHAQFGWGGGMEHQTMSFMGGFSFGLIAHELAHQWFGDYITLSSWQDIWLNEGFATYLNAMAIEKLRPNDWAGWKKSTVQNITGQSGGSVFVYDTTSVNRIFDYRLSYQKASYLLHMLRWVMGDEAFLEGIRAYYNDPEIANGFASTPQLQKHLEAAADTSLQQFFSDWLYGEGYPVYSLTYWQNGAGELTLKLSQTTTHSTAVFFEMPVPVRIYSMDGSSKLDLRLNNQINDQQFTFEPGFEVASIEIDPDYWLISKTAQIVSVPPDSKTQQVDIYPNPANQELIIKVSSEIKPEVIRIYSSNGNLLKQFPGELRQFNVSDLSAGVYIIEIKTAEESLTQKFLKD